MSRIARIIGVGYPHHIIQRGNNSMEEIRKHTRLGKPLGDGEFLNTLAERLGRSLSFKPKGKPRKK